MRCNFSAAAARVQRASTAACACDALQVRLYPDVSHTLTAMYPVPDWHFAWAFTHGRQVCDVCDETCPWMCDPNCCQTPNPLPSHMSDIISTNCNSSFQMAGSVGFGSCVNPLASLPLGSVLHARARCSHAVPSISTAFYPSHHVVLHRQRRRQRRLEQSNVGRSAPVPPCPQFSFPVALLIQ